MRIVEFRCVGLNAFLNYSFHFHSDVSFLYGINGSGKTSVLRAIASLLTPDPYWLLNTEYRELYLSIEHQNRNFTIISARADRLVTISISGAGLHVIRDTVDPEDARVLSRISDEDYRHVTESEELAFRTRTFVEQYKSFKFISELPTPIFLGLDRTTLTQGYGRATPKSRRARSIHPYFRTQLDDAIQEAERLLTQQLSTISLERNKIFAALRNQFVLSLFQVPTERRQTVFDVANQQFPQRQAEMRESVITALQKINVGREQIEEVVEPFFREMHRVWELAAGAKSPEKDDQKALLEYVSKITPQMNFRPYISIIEGTLSKIEAANNQDRSISKTIDHYQEIMNSFFGDSRKYLLLDENNVNVLLPNGKISDITSLSSGERQIFVLITHLVFNPSIRGENILLIDEPELSLHLKWQRQFVSSIRNASPTTQMVLATHSPEIIFDLANRLIPLSA